MGLIKQVSDAVQGKAPLSAKRSSHWPKVRADFLKDHPACALCGGTKNLEVHHKKPFHLFPDLELDPNNLITLCENKGNGVNCHLFFGHLGNFKSLNESVEADTAAWSVKIKNRPANPDSSDSEDEKQIS